MRALFRYLPKRPKRTNSLIKREMCEGNERDVILEVINNKGVITLNRPKVLNALNLSMVQKMIPALQRWEKENKTCVIIKGAGGKAFCPGGDVKNAVLKGSQGFDMRNKFFGEVYAMIGLIGNYRVPYIALIDGIVMGGANGISVPGKYRIATERSVFSLPETQIGLFPDAGASYFLPRLRGKLGTYLALTGERLKGSDLVKAGIATHYTESSKLQELERELLNCERSNDLDNVLRKFCVDDGKPFVLEPVLNQIDKCFSAENVEGIFENLKSDGSDWSKETLETLGKMSPTSLKVTLRAMEEGAKASSLTDALIIEYRAAVVCMSNHDFKEGVRALLIDKDQKPDWKPDRLEDVTDEIVNRHFVKLPEDQELKHKL